MIVWTQISVALLLGYALAVGGLLVVTFALTSAVSPAFVAKQYRVTPQYKRLQAIIWLLCVTAGAFVTCVIAQGAHPWMVPGLLAAAFLTMLWRNTWEARQRGVAHQILMSLMTLSGVIAGYVLAVRLFNIPWN
jgi:hypothetical protein